MILFHSPYKTVQSLLEVNLDWIACKVDFINAFNTIRRKVVLENLFSHPQLSQIWRLAHFLYSDPSLLYLFDGVQLVDTLLSQEGVRQGDVLGPLLFCIGVHKLYEECMSVSGAQGVAIADDFTLVGRPD